MELNSIAFIPDGNRRYAKCKGISLPKCYSLGTKKAWQVLEWLNSYPKIKAGTFYTLSLENMKRNSVELKILLKIFEKEMDRVISSGIFNANGLKLKFIGRLNLLPENILRANSPPVVVNSR